MDKPAVARCKPCLIAGARDYVPRCVHAETQTVQHALSAGLQLLLCERRTGAQLHSPPQMARLVTCIQALRGQLLRLHETVSMCCHSAPGRWRGSCAQTGNYEPCTHRTLPARPSPLAAAHNAAACADLLIRLQALVHQLLPPSHSCVASSAELALWCSLPKWLAAAIAVLLLFACVVTVATRGADFEERLSCGTPSASPPRRTHRCSRRCRPHTPATRTGVYFCLWISLVWVVDAAGMQWNSAQVKRLCLAGLVRQFLTAVER